MATSPDYTKVIPEGNQNIARIEHEELLQPCAGSLFFQAMSIKMEFKEDMPSISANNPRFGRSDRKVEMDYKRKAKGLVSVQRAQR